MRKINADPSLSSISHGKWGRLSYKFNYAAEPFLKSLTNVCECVILEPQTNVFDDAM